ncbi:methylmalonyl-CoA mutase family protein [Mesobacillus thioparans]|uniref:methylmalonyl-CoA mutase family protein n=1 Tax=Mesobacillus thioparans TaxID=370439 RepID=UPI0039EE1DC3
MTIESMKAASFNDALFEDWQKKAAASLKGRPIESLYTHTYEDITLKPLYTKDDLPDGSAEALPGTPDYRRGIDPLGYQSESWNIANRLFYKDLQDLKAKMDSALSKGQTAISFVVKSDLFRDQQALAELFASYRNDYPLSLNAGWLQTPLLAALSMACKQAGDSSNVAGFVAADPVAEASLNGGLPKEEKAFFADWAKVLEEADQQWPQLKTVLANTVPYHDCGANAVQELAAGISTGVYLLQQLLDQGWELKKALSKFVFHFAIGSNFFMETAKLRAARILWSKIAEAYGAESGDQKMVLSAETSRYTKTIFDPYVNMLRTGNEAFAAVLGGVQYLHTGSFEEAAGTVSAFSERVARNTQLVLKSEAHLEKVADPAGGSWYIESLTNELAEKAWELFLELDDRGGIYEALKSGWLQEQIAKTADAREQDIFKRKKSIIGTNVYANLSEAVSQPEVQDRKSQYFGGTLVESVRMIESEDSLLKRFEDIEQSFAPLESKRLSQPFEQLRFRAIGLEKIGKRPVVGLICLDQLKNHKPRADFISGLLSAGGIHTLRSDEIHNVQQALDFINESNAEQFVICGDQTSYNSFGPELALEIKKESDVKLYLAGIPEEKESEWNTAGIQDFLHVRSNAYQSLSSILQEMEVGTNAKA